MNRSIHLLLTAAFVAAAGAGAAGRLAQTAVFTGRTELTVLEVVVTDGSGRYVARLPRDAFTVYEDGAVQPIEVFSGEDTPATIGLLVDSSASMFAMRDLVIAAAGTFAATSNPADEFFALTFNEHVRAVLPADEPFTSDPVRLESALRSALTARGRTALHDALAEGLAYLDRGHHARKVLVVVSDGADNASAASFEQVAHAAAAANTVIYAIATIDRNSRDGRPDRLKALAARTGGTAHVSHDARVVRHALERVARDIRSSYTVGYVPPPAGPAVRHVRVTVHGSRGEDLHARSRTEYVRPRE